MDVQTLPRSPIAPSTPAVPAQPRERRLTRLWRGRPEDPSWARPALVLLLVGTALLYLWDLGASGWANSFYSAAVQAGSVSWKAFFFGSSDAASSITVDKTPLALWPMDLSVRIFGLSSWSILVPQALEGVAAVGLLHATVRRTTRSTGAALLAGAALALTPVAALMFRFNNPDAMLVLLLVAATAATLRAVEATERPDTRPQRWLVLAGGLVGLAFLAKMLQAFLVLPGLVLVYLVCARFIRRLGHLVTAFAAMLVAGGWWVLAVELWPASSRPYIGGSQHNSILELALGYNGFGRLDGNETGSVGGGGGGTGQWGSTGLTRLFSSDIGGQVAWLLPAALVLLVAGLWFARRQRAAFAGLVAWGGWLLVTGLTFSMMAGIFHQYYTVALAPAIAALVGIGAHVLWQRRDSYPIAVLMALVTAVTTVWSIVLLDRSASFVPWLRWVILVVGLLATAGLLANRLLGRRLLAVAVAATVVAGLAGPAAYAVDTAATPHTGSIPTAGPAVASSTGFGGGMPGGTRGGFGGPGATTGRPTGGGFARGGSSAGSLLDGSNPSTALTELLEEDSSSYTWVAAAVGSNVASGYQLATQLPVMPIGGFNGSDPSPTLAQFKAYVAAGRIHWFIASGGSGGGGGRGGASPGGSTSTAISQWVAKHFTAKTVDGVTLYDLSGGAQ